VINPQQQLRGNGQVIESLGHALSSGEHGLSTVPGLLKRVLIEGSWHEFYTKRNEHVAHEKFVEFVTTPPLKGLGASVDLIRRIVSDDTEANDLLDQALQRGPGNPTGVNQHTKGTFDNIQDSTQAPTGTSGSAALRRLRKDRRDLYELVLAGELSPHAAMVEAGFRPKTFTVRADDPDAIARTLRRRLEPDVLARVAELLTVVQQDQ
jgi:hypothetical protein